MFENHKLSLPPPSVTAEPQPRGWRGQRHRAQGSAPAPAAMNRGEAPGAKATTWPGPPGNRQGASADPKTAGHGGTASWLPTLGGARKRHLYLPLPLSPFPTHTHTQNGRKGASSRTKPPLPHTPRLRHGTKQLLSRQKSRPASGDNALCPSDPHHHRRRRGWGEAAGSVPHEGRGLPGAAPVTHRTWWLLTTRPATSKGGLAGGLPPPRFL